MTRSAQQRNGDDADLSLSIDRATLSDASRNLHVESQAALAGAPACSPDESCGSITLFIENLREFRDSSAAQHLFERYFDQLIASLKRKLPRRANSEDLAAYALSEALLKLRDGAYPDLANRNELWLLLLSIADLRNRHLWRYETADRRDIRRTKSASALACPDDERSHAVFDFVRQEPTPDLVVAVKEQLENLYGKLDDKHRALMLWELQGYTPGEIRELYSQRKGHYVADRTIYRKRDNIRRKLDGLASDC